MFWLLIKEHEDGQRNEALCLSNRNYMFKDFQTVEIVVWNEKWSAVDRIFTVQ